MKHVNLADVPEQEIRSPGGKFHSFFRNVSLALGNQRNVGTWGGGHPFDFQVRRIPPGASVCPFHSHYGQWEFFLVRKGTGTVRTTKGIHPIAEGDLFYHPPAHPHQLTNTGDTDLEVFIFADNPPMDACFYPDSNKWALRPPGKIFRMALTDYFDGEEATVEGAPNPMPPPALAETPPVPFAQRHRATAQLPWAKYTSPKGKYSDHSQEWSEELGAKRNAHLGAGGHPFDLSLTRVAPGGTVTQYHWHAAQWEMYIVLSGALAMRTAEGIIPAPAGEVFIHPPYDAHQIINPSNAEATFLIVADNPPADYWFYPDSNKWGFREPRKFFRLAEADYFDGAE
ncbi:MAG TPA: cupin domain-containing protein [Candidatus Didemnitutus sp.]|nr:cupin domain-containing protein [Candidatus Didemnitutus sp.]